LGFTGRIHATEHPVAVVPAESPGDGDVLKMNGTTRVGGGVASKDAGAKAVRRHVDVLQVNVGVRSNARCKKRMPVSGCVGRMCR